VRNASINQVSQRIESSELLLALTSCLKQLATCRIVRRAPHEETRRISMTTRKESVAALQLRYGSATIGDPIWSLVRGFDPYYRKHAIRLLRQAPGATKRARGRNRCTTRRL
jgi:hypothetical protein